LKTRCVLGQAEEYLRGLAQAGRRNMERMAEVVPGTNYQRLQNFATNSPWSERAVMGQVAEEADQLLGGEPDSSLLIDESGFAKKGEDSVGVARQWCGRLGKVDNCQVGVFGVLSNGARYALIDARLYLPKEWISDPARCESAGIPAAEVVARSKSEHALAIVAQARAQGVRFNWVGVDAGYGKEPAFLRALDAAGEIFVADVHKSQVIYLADPQPCVPEPKDGRGRPSQRLQAQTPGIRVDAWLAQQPAEAWQRLTLRDSTRGELRVEALSQRVWLWDGEETAAHCWHLIVRREIGSRDTIKFTLSNAPAETSLERLAQMQGQRYWVERSFQDAKSDCGMADYQVRKWTGWHHHMAMVMIAMLFMAEERTAQKDSVPLLSCADIIALLKHFLPQAAVTREEVIEQMHVRHDQRAASIESAYRVQQRKRE
jgi:SRSO17 transposase